MTERPPHFATRLGTHGRAPTQRPFKPDDEAGRKCALDRLQILDTEPDQDFERISSLVATCFEVPIAAVSLIDTGRQWFKSIQGLDAVDINRGDTFCTHAIKNQGCLNVGDVTTDLRFSRNPYVLGEPFVRSYLGAPLITPDGYAIGTICAIDRRTRTFTPHHEDMIAGFADVVMNQVELLTLACKDQLTQLATRRTFVEALKSIGPGETPNALIYIDLDHFKNINDTLGHPVGDEVLSQVGNVMIEHCPGNGIAGRLGGEELALLIPGINRESALLRAEALRKSIARIRIDGHPDLSCTASVGVAMRGEFPSTDSWMAAADEALYWAKDNGRNRVVEAASLPPN